MKLHKNRKYLQVALNSTLSEAKEIISKLPLSERILIEAGTPLIKAYGRQAILSLREYITEQILGPKAVRKEGADINSLIKIIKESKKRDYYPPSTLQSHHPPKKEEVNWKSLLFKEGEKSPLPFEPYIVADLKCMDLAVREVRIATEAGANAATCLGQAPIEAIDRFIEECQKYNLDSMIDMMNLENPILTLRKLKKLPNIVILHRGVDETKKNREKQIPWYQIQQIKGNYNDVLVSVAGGDTIKEIQSAIFNDADIVVLWKAFYRSTAKTTKLAKQFLEEIR